LPISVSIYVQHYQLLIQAEKVEEFVLSRMSSTSNETAATTTTSKNTQQLAVLLKKQYLQKQVGREDDKQTANKTISSAMKGSSRSSSDAKKKEALGNYYVPLQNNKLPNAATTPTFRIASKRTPSKQKKLRKVMSIPLRRASMFPNATFSSCLLIKDDNAILNKWIAYHYHTLRLRKLVVALDPYSVQSPTALFDTWRTFTNLTIVEWHDRDYMTADFLERERPPDEYVLTKVNFSFPGNLPFPLSDETLRKISNHRYRQRVFLTKCMEYLMRSAQKDRSNDHPSWMVHIDSDEYVVPSKKWRQQGTGVAKLPSLEESKNPNEIVLRKKRPSNIPLLQPSMEKEDSLVAFVQHVSSHLRSDVSYPCLSLLRVLFGSIEDPDLRALQQQQIVPQGFDARQFETLRWRYHGDPRNLTLNGNPKVIVDLLAIPQSYFRTDDNKLVFSIHRPVHALCRRNTDTNYDNWWEQPLVSNHYLGSWERYSDRDDSRRTRSVFNAKSEQQYGEDDFIRNWLRGFVEHVGNDRATVLLGKRYESAMKE